MVVVLRLPSSITLRGGAALCLTLSLLSCQTQNPRLEQAESDMRNAAALDLTPLDAPPPSPPKLIPDPPSKALSIVTIKSVETLHDDGKHDESNDAIAILQDPTVALEGFPLDRRQQVNWVKALDEGLIQPRPSLNGTGEMLVMDMDILFTNTKDMPYVRFPHLQHTRWLDCSNCHPRIFIPRRGANPVSMNKVLRGEFCGVCHDKVAFSLFICERCHSVPHEGSGKWW